MVKPINFQFKQIVDEKLKNNSRLTIYHFPDDISMFSTFINTGSKYEVFKDYTIDSKPKIKIIDGLAHLIEHLIFSFDSNDTLNNSNIQESVYKSNGIYNASTDDILTTYHFTCINKTITQNLKVFFNIFKRLKERITEDKIKTEIEAITNEQKKNFSFEFLNIYSIIQQLSDNIIFKHNTCGTYKTLDIQNIILFIKLFYKTFYIPENFRFILIINEQKTDIKEVKNIFYDFADFYHNEFINLMLQPLPKQIIDFSYSLNKTFINESEITKQPKIKKGKIVNLYNKNKNQFYLFYEFNIKDLKNYGYIKFITWLMNKKDNTSLTEILKNNFNIFNFTFSVYNYSSESFFFIFILDLPKKSIKQKNQIFNTIDNYLATLKNLNNELFKDLVNEYETDHFLNCIYSQEFTNYDINTIINGTIYQNLKLDFNCSNLLLNQYNSSNNFNIEYFKQLVNNINLNDFLIFCISTDSTIQPNNVLKLSEDFGYNIKFNVSDFRLELENKKIQNIFKIPESKKNNYKSLIVSTKQILNNCQYSLNSKYPNIQEFNETKINGIKIKYKTVYYSCFETSAVLNFYINIQKDKKDIDLKIINYLLIFEFIVYIINKEYNVLNSTNFIFDYSFNSFKSNKIVFYFSVLNDYFIFVLLRMLELLNLFINQIDKIKTILKNNEKYLVEKTKTRLLKEIENNKIGDRYKLKSFYFNNHINIYNVIGYLENQDFNHNYENLQISKLDIFVLFPYLNNDKTVTNFLNTVKLSTNNHYLYKNEPNSIIDFKELNPKTKNKIIGIYENDQIKNILVIPEEKYKNFKCTNKLNFWLKAKPLIDAKSNKNFLLSTNILIDVQNPIKDDYLIFVIKEHLFKSFFNYFRVKKKYSYAVISKNDNLNQNTQIIKMLLIVDNNKINYNFVFNFYDEVKTFLSNQLKHYQNLDNSVLFNYQNLYTSYYNKKYNNSLTELLDYNKKIEKYKKVYDNNEIKEIITKINTDQVVNFYINNFINQPFNLLIYKEDD